MNYDVVVLAPPFLDVGFLGLPRLPHLGEELHAPELVFGPGGGAIIAVATARLGLRTALAWPVGTDLAGRWVADALAEDGVDWIGPPTPSTPVTAILALEDDRAMVTHRPPEPDTPDWPPARAVITGMGRTAAATAGGSAAVYAMTDYADSDRHVGGALPALSGCRALVLNESEAERLSGVAGAAASATALRVGTGADTVVVTRGGEGAFAVAGDGECVTMPAAPARVLDATGAGDVFAAAYVWADLGGLALSERLALATLAAAHAVGVPSGAAGAPHQTELIARARAAGLALPAC